MHLTEILRTHTFRTAAMACAAFGAVTLLLFGFIYWQTAGLETYRIDQFILHEATAFAHEDMAAMAAEVNTRYSADLHRESFAAIFAASGARLAGGLADWPNGLPADGVVHECIVLRPGDRGAIPDRAHAVAHKLPNGEWLVVGRSEADLAKLRLLVIRALWLGLAPALLAALCIGVLASRRTIVRVRDMNRAIARIMQGHLEERLPSAGKGDALAQLTSSCNSMLAEIERLLAEVKGVGENIAHDLRSPLARLRTRMEIGLLRSRDQAALTAVLKNSIAELDQALAIITALLRIGELQSGLRRAAFGQINLFDLTQEAAELYTPMATDRGLRFALSTDPVDDVVGDRALLLEVVINLLDNAVKFAPPGGSVSLAVLNEEPGPVIRIADTGRGIAEAERSAVLERFYRTEPNRHIAGSGVGLSLVSAILRLHGFGLRMSDGAFGFAVDVLCWPQRTSAR